MKKDIKIIVQRYGLEIRDGAELHARMVAEKLSDKYNVTVLTSCALDPVSWEPFYAEGKTTVNGISVIRFKNTPRRSGREVHRIERKFRERHIPQKIFRWLGRPQWYARLFAKQLITDEDGKKWLLLFGPGMPELLTYLKEKERETTAYIFFSAVYYPTAMGLLTVPRKSILVPTIHDDPLAHFPIYQKVMAAARWILFNTKAEQEFCEGLFPIEAVKKSVVAVGITPNPPSDEPSALQKFGITKRYFLYLGRIDAHKGCDTLLEYFTKAVDENNLDVQLVLAGKLLMEKSMHPAVIYTGLVTEQEKATLIKHAEAFLMASLFESLSLVMLESFAGKVPVIATAHTQVLKDHIEMSGGGWLYSDYSGFALALQEALEPKERRERGTAGYEYLLTNYTWEKVLPQYDEAIAFVADEDNK